jgi:hypothetical protein
MDKITGVRGRRMLAALSPTDQAIALEYVGDGFLLAMMMDAGTGSGLNDEYPAPKLGCDTIVSRDRSATLGPWRLRRSPIELGRSDDAKGGIFAHKEAFIR